MGARQGVLKMTAEIITFRPKRTRIVLYAISAALALFTLVLAILMPGGAIYSYVWRVTVPVCSALIIAMLVLLARPHAIASDEALTVINLVAGQRFAWPEIVAVRFAKDAPWASLDIADGRNVPLMAIQNSDGKWAREQAEKLADLVSSRSAGQQP
jgi:hypothetical protein